MSALGSLQIVVLDYANPEFPARAYGQLKNLHTLGVIRLVDSLITEKDMANQFKSLGPLEKLEDCCAWSGVLAKSLLGRNQGDSTDFRGWQDPDQPGRQTPEIGATEEQLLEVVDRIPTGSRALILLIEHVWTTALEAAAAEASGHLLANCWTTPEFLEQSIRKEQPLLI